MLKADLRKHYLAERRALSADEVNQRSQQIATRLLAQLSSLVADRRLVLHTFLPIQRHNEVDTWSIIHQIWDRYPQIQIAVPVTDMAQLCMRHYVITPETPFFANSLGIPEPPADGLELQPDELSIVLVPLLVFDGQGDRVGYGGGFYDRFLAQCEPHCLKIGLSLFAPIEQIDDVVETDIRLNSCVTPDRYWVFGS
ncbi:5-formyltetrahydrofolate cyclo-ligase [Spirosoma sp. KUDC1026]|uniref:5-formyltetrahydrofolate cyclo-ligase n=1 Tax=Spirosoma sp. KUDC1026 TaxID=2745947 RepID=UPI00159BCF99|nr:5-formyltetrahydrofolate cyclo-ligase [Spirosoma sp. KUDC1026]QKZ11512.1 5-formyltetrahydrofolate cyclo-ligase [Spirosoma sp. KUDC1026]